MPDQTNELVQALIGESAHAAPSHILEALDEDKARRQVTGAPHTIYEELWHMAFWQQVSLDWIAGTETPYPAAPCDAFPNQAQAAEQWPDLGCRFFAGVEQGVAIAHDSAQLMRIVRCPSRPGQPIREMTVQDQLLSVAAHNAYHFGRIVLLRQLLGFWPPPSGGFRW